MVTMAEVARRAGVSVSTVSHVINGTRFVKEETRKRVLAAINDTGYVRNTVAKSLVSGSVEERGCRRFDQWGRPQTVRCSGNHRTRKRPVPDHPKARRCIRDDVLPSLMCSSTHYRETRWPRDIAGFRIGPFISANAVVGRLPARTMAGVDHVPIRIEVAWQQATRIRNRCWRRVGSGESTTDLLGLLRVSTAKPVCTLPPRARIVLDHLDGGVSATDTIIWGRRFSVVRRDVHLALGVAGRLMSALIGTAAGADACSTVRTDLARW